MFNSPKKINPLDLNERKAIGIDLPLNSPGVFKPNYQTKDAIKYDLINFLLTDPGERPLNPTFGGGIKAFIFEQINNNTLDLLEQDLQFKIESYFPIIVINELNVTETINSNEINISINYTISTTKTQDQILITV